MCEGGVSWHRSSEDLTDARVFLVTSGIRGFSLPADIDTRLDTRSERKTPILRPCEVHGLV